MTGNPTPQATTPPATQRADGAVGVPTANWYVAIVNARHEKAVAQRLLDTGHTAYVATQQELHIWKNGRRKKIDRVVIPSVVFIRCTEQQRRQIVTLPYICRFMVNRTAAPGTHARPVAIVPDDQIQKLRFMLGQTDYPVDFQPVAYRVNDNVRIIRGPLAGLTGQVTAATTSSSPSSPQTITILIAHLGCAHLTIPARDLAPL